MDSRTQPTPDVPPPPRWDAAMLSADASLPPVKERRLRPSHGQIAIILIVGIIAWGSTFAVAWDANANVQGGLYFFTTPPDPVSITSMVRSATGAAIVGLSATTGLVLLYNKARQSALYDGSNMTTLAFSTQGGLFAPAIGPGLPIIGVGALVSIAFLLGVANTPPATLSHALTCGV